MANQDFQQMRDLVNIGTQMAMNTYNGNPPLFRPTRGNALVHWYRIVNQFGAGPYAHIIANAPDFVPPPPPSLPPGMNPFNAPGLGRVASQLRDVQQQLGQNAFGGPLPPAHPLSGRVGQLKRAHPSPYDRVPTQQARHNAPPGQIQYRLGWLHPHAQAPPPFLQQPHQVQQQDPIQRAIDDIVQRAQIPPRQPARLLRRAALPGNEGGRVSRVQRRQRKQQRRSILNGFTLPPQHPPRFQKIGTLASGYGEPTRPVSLETRGQLPSSNAGGANQGAKARTGGRNDPVRQRESARRDVADLPAVSIARMSNRERLTIWVDEEARRVGQRRMPSPRQEDNTAAMNDAVQRQEPDAADVVDAAGEGDNHPQQEKAIDQIQQPPQSPPVGNLRPGVLEMEAHLPELNRWLNNPTQVQSDHPINLGRSFESETVDRLMKGGLGREWHKRKKRDKEEEKKK